MRRRVRMKAPRGMGGGSELARHLAGGMLRAGESLGPLHRLAITIRNRTAVREAADVSQHSRIFIRSTARLYDWLVRAAWRVGPGSRAGCSVDLQRGDERLRLGRVGRGARGASARCQEAARLYPQVPASYPAPRIPNG